MLMLAPGPAPKTRPDEVWTKAVTVAVVMQPTTPAVAVKAGPAWAVAGFMVTLGGTGRACGLELLNETTNWVLGVAPVKLRFTKPSTVCPTCTVPQASELVKQFKAEMGLIAPEPSQSAPQKTIGGREKA